MLSLTDATALLIYTRRRVTVGRAEYDISARNSTEVRLLVGAALMDLLLLRRVQVRSVSLAGRRLRAIVAILVFVVIAAPFLGLSLPDPWSSVRSPIGTSPLATVAIGIVVPFLAVLAVGWIFGWVLRDKLAILDRAPTGDWVLDEALLQLDHIGRQVSIDTCLRSFGQSGLLRIRDASIAQLVRNGLLTPPTPGLTNFGSVDGWTVRSESPEFQAIGERMRSLVLEHTTVEPQEVALLLIFAWSTYFRAVGRKLHAGIYLFFAPEEYDQLHAYLRTLRRRRSDVAAQVDPGLFDALRAIAVGVVQLHGPSGG